MINPIRATVKCYTATDDFELMKNKILIRIASFRT